MSRSEKWRPEWAFFLGENGRRQHNYTCRKCVHGRKQRFRACACPHYSSKRSKTYEDKSVKNRRIILSIRIFKESLYDFSCDGLLTGTRRKSSISNTFRYAKWEYSFSVRPIGCTPVFYLFSSLSGFFVSATLSIMSTTTALSCAAFCDVMTGRPVSFSISCRT